MWKSITGRITLIAVLTAVSIIVLLPSLTDRVPAGWKDKMPKINLGLDLQGGVFLRLAVDIDKAIENTSMRYADDARAVCREKALPSSPSRRSPTAGSLSGFPRATSPPARRPPSRMSSPPST
jgi:preprotein translocase subunit SecD